MTEAIQEIFKNIFGNNVILATILISMLPIIELRGAIPFGMSKTFWGANALKSWESFAFSFLGSSLVVPIIALLLKPILSWLKKTKLFKSLALKLENSFKKKSKKIEADMKVEDADTSSDENVPLDTSNEKRKTVYDKGFFLRLFGITLFVAIPLPLTGVWTGTAIAVMMNIPFGWTCLSVILGNLIAGLIMQTICAVFPNFTTWILIIFLCVTAVLIIYYLIKNKIKKNKINKEKI